MIRNRSGVEQRNLFERRFGPEHLDLADVLERYPDLIVFRTHRNVGAEGTGLRYPLNDLMGCRVNHRQFWSETTADGTGTAVGTKNRHSRTVRQPNTPYFFHRLRIDHRNVVLSPDSDPQFAAIGRKERLVRRTPYVNSAPYLIRRRVD